MKQPERIYIRGDVAQPMDCRIYDADTGELLRNVTSMQLTVKPNELTIAEVRVFDDVDLRSEWKDVPQLMFRAEVVAPPPHPMAGKRVVEYSLRQERDHGFNGEAVTATEQEYVVSHRGDLMAGKTHEQRHVVSDQVLYCSYEYDIIKEAIRMVVAKLVRTAIERLIDIQFPETTWSYDDAGHCTACGEHRGRGHNVGCPGVDDWKKKNTGGKTKSHLFYSECFDEDIVPKPKFRMANPDGTEAVVDFGKCAASAADAAQCGACWSFYNVGIGRPCGNCEVTP